MNYIKASLALIVAFSAMAIGVGVSNEAQATTTACLDGSRYQSYTVSYASRYQGTITTVGGKPICKNQPFVFQSFNLASTYNGKDFLTSLPQTIHGYTRFTFPANKANHKMTVNVTAPDLCKPTQIDFFVGSELIHTIPKSNPQAGEDREVRSGQIFTGKTNCEAPVKDIKVCELATKKIITIKETAFDKNKHSKNLDDCKTVEVPTIKVCELATKKVITIKETAFDSKKHSKDLDDCKTVVVAEPPVETPVEPPVETPVTPTPVAPAPTPVVELPQTGPLEAINFFGAATALGLATYNILRRFN